MQKLEPVTTLRVRYAETDKMGIVYNANYLTWFEIARTELCRSLGKSYAYWETTGIKLPVVESYCRYKRPALYDEVVQLWCHTKDIYPYSIKFCYRIMRQSDHKLIAEGWTKHAFTDSQGHILKTQHEFYNWITAFQTATNA